MNTLSPCRSTLPVRKFRLMSLALLALTSLTAVQAARIDRYVDKASATPSSPYNAWTNAAPDIQSAVNAAVAAQGDQVIVRAGIYDSGGTVAPNRMLTNRVYISTAITVRSENNDPATTIIKGAWDPVKTNGPAAVRCVYMVNGASLIGFTLTNGATITTAERIASLINSDASGGGVWAASASTTISNCVITGNAASADHWNGYSGGGAFQGTYFNCTLAGNTSDYAGGAQDATLYNCTLSGNLATVDHGGGAKNCTLYGCVISNNSTSGIGSGGGLYKGAAYNSTLVGNTGFEGGGAYEGTLTNCTISLNVARQRGGGVSRATLSNCQVVSNQCLLGNQWGGGAYLGVHSNSVFAYNVALTGGGARGGTLYNCLIYGNQASGDGGGILESALINCTVIGNYGAANGGGVANWGSNINVINSIIYGNKAGLSRDDCGGYLTLSNCCFTTNSGSAVTAVINSTTNSPRLIDSGSGYGTNHLAGNYRLQGTSPCLNTGLTLGWMTGLKDLDGNPRLDKMSGIVDMGTYEYVYTGTTILVR